MGCKNRKPVIILGILVLSIMLLMIYMIAFQSKSRITIEEGGIIVVRNNNGEEWYDANDSFHELFYEMYME